MFSYFKNAVHNSKPAQEYISSRKLNWNTGGLEIGYNAAQFHHGTRKDETLIEQCLKYGLLMDAGQIARTGEKAYRVFGKSCIVFVLKNKAGQISGLYFRSTINNDNAKHFYLKDRSGLYPGYPKVETKKLIITESIIDAATLLQLPAITENYSILAAYGTNGMNEEIVKSIKELKELEEIVFTFDTDEAGKAAVIKYAGELHQLLPKLTLSALNLPCKDVNETALAHEDEIFTQLLEERIPLPPEEGKVLFLSTEGILQTTENKLSIEKENPIPDQTRPSKKNFPG